MNLLRGDQHARSIFAEPPRAGPGADRRRAQAHPVVRDLRIRGRDSSRAATAPQGRDRAGSSAGTRVRLACEIQPLNNRRVMKYLDTTLGLGKPERKAWIQHWIKEGFAALERMLADPATGSSAMETCRRLRISASCRRWQTRCAPNATSLRFQRCIGSMKLVRHFPLSMLPPHTTSRMQPCRVSAETIFPSTSHRCPPQPQSQRQEGPAMASKKLIASDRSSRARTPRWKRRFPRSCAHEKPSSRSASPSTRAACVCRR